MTTTLTPPSGFTPRSLSSWNRYYIPQSDTNAYRVGDAVKSAGGTDTAGIVAVTLHLGTGPARGVIVAVDPGLPATGGLTNGQRLNVPATKRTGYYVWVDDDPSHQFAMVDDGLNPGNSVAASAGKYANFTPGATVAANGGSTAAITSSTLGSTSGCLQVLSLQDGSSYGAAATWIVKFAAHELANGGAGGGSGISTVAAASDYNANVVDPIAAAAAAALAAQNKANNAIPIPTQWAASGSGGSPHVSDASAVVGAAFQNTTPGTTTFSPTIGGVASLNFNDCIVCFVAGVFTVEPGAVQTPAQIAAGATAGVLAVDASGVIYNPDGTVLNLQTKPLLVTGTLGIGNVLTAAAATGWIATSYQWRRNASNISGATSSTYTQANADALQTIDCVGTESPVTSAGVVPGIAPTITATASILVAVAGSPLTFTTPTATGAPTPTLANDVMSGGSVVQAGVTSGSYTPPAGGPSLAIRTTASNGVNPNDVQTGSAVTVSAAGFPALSAPAVLLMGDSLGAHEHQNIGINNTISRAVTTGRMTQSATNSNIANNLIGTPEVQFTNLTDPSMEVNGRAVYADGAGGTNGLSVHTVVADPIATGAWSFNPTTSGSATAALSNGTIINLTRKSHRGVAINTSALFGAGINVIGNLGYPGAKSTDMVNALAYAKQICAQFTNPLVFLKLGTNDIKGSVTPNNAFAGIKVILDGLTGLDGNGGNALVQIGSVPMLGSAFSGYATVNPQSIGTCSASGSPTVLAPDSTMYTTGGVSQHTLNYQLWQYALAHPSKFLFVDETTDSYDTTNHCMYDATHLDSTSSAHTSDGTHWLTNSAILQAKRRHDALVAASVTFPSAIPSSSSDSSTFNGHTRLASHGPWNGDATKTTGFLGTTSTGTQPNSWTCGTAANNVTCVFSIEAGTDGTGGTDSLGDWVKCVMTPTAANASVAFYPWTNGGVTIGTLGLTNADNTELQFACEVKWDTARAAGLALVQAVMQTNSAGLYGFTTSGEETETPALGGLPDNVSGRALATGWMQNSSASITGVIPLLTVKFGAITGTSMTFWMRRAAINKR